MDIIIKGMKIPKNCHECPMCYSKEVYDFSEYCCVSNAEINGTKRPSDCPLIDPVEDWKFTDKEKRIFLAAMGRELNICKEMDKKYPIREAYEDTLESVCRNIIRKVKGVLWT